MKKAFTIIELLIVIVILGVLFLGLKGLFQKDDRDFLKSQICYNNIYADIRDYMDTAITRKRIYTGNKGWFPTRYLLSINTGDAVLTYDFNYGITGYRYKQQDIKLDSYCYSDAYHTDIGGSTNLSGIKINAGLGLGGLNIGTLNDPVFVISGAINDMFTGELFFRYCSNGDNPICKDIGKIIIDKRIPKITQNRCLTRNTATLHGDQTCDKRSLGE